MSTSATTEIQFGVPLDPSSFVFFGCLAAALGLVYLFCRKKFAERSVTGDDDYVYQLLPRQLATQEEYSRGFLIYFGAMFFTVVLCSLIGPKNLHSLGIPVPSELSYVVVPLAVAFLLVGIVPNTPLLQEVERWLRQHAHERAYIPAAARATAQRLSAADFDFSAYSGEALQAPEMSGVEQGDFTQSRRALEHDWARLSCLVYELKSRRLLGLTDALDAELLRNYERDLESIEDKRQSMKDEVARYRAEKLASPTYTNNALRQTIRSNLYKLYILLGCAVRLKKQPHDDIDLALRPFGFRLHQMTPPPNNWDLQLVGMVVMAASMLLLDYVAVAVAHLKLWMVSAYFPQAWYQPFYDTASAVILYGSAIAAAEVVRAHRLKRGTWLGGAGWQPSITGNHIRVAIVCGATTYITSIIWGLAFQGITLGELKFAAPFALLGAVTGGFYVYHLDQAEFRRRGSRLREVGSQALATGICGLIAATASFATVLTDLPVDQILLTTAMATTAGASLGWYIPEAASAAKYDPFSNAREERIRALETAAIDHFGERIAAVRWLETPHRLLGDKSPKAAAADVENFEHAMGLLQGPREIAA